MDMLYASDATEAQLKILSSIGVTYTTRQEKAFRTENRAALFAHLVHETIDDDISVLMPHIAGKRRVLLCCASAIDKVKETLKRLELRGAKDVQEADRQGRSFLVVGIGANDMPCSEDACVGTEGPLDGSRPFSL